MARPPFYKTAKQMQKKIDEYFKSCEGVELTDEDGKIVRNKGGYPVMIGRKPPTTGGLALALGFKSRQALLNYQARDEKFNDTLMRAKLRIEAYAEERLYDKEGSAGAQFNLRNNFKGWDADKKEKEETADKITIVNNIPRE